MSRKVVLVILILAAVMMLLIVPAVYASVYNGTVIFSCINADAAGTGSHTLDRDNTGSGQEALRVDITDGYGTLIYTLSFSNVLGTFAGGIGDFFYTTAPAANPITFTLTSLAGNGLPEQVDYVAQGSCDGLPTVGTANCPNPQPTSFTVQNIPAGALAYFQPSADAYAGFNLPPGTWYAGAAEDGFVEVWIACEATNIFVPAENVTG
jgi:hypothetical protein